jgi:hypothetical protein
MKVTRRDFAKGSALSAGLLGFGSITASRVAGAFDVSIDQARAIAKEAYIYGFPMIDGYRIAWAYFVDKGGGQYKGPINAIHSAANVFTPADTAVQTPNSDTPYSFAWLDLRAEPLVLTLPKIEEDRYYSVQMVDLYTFNFDYLGTRATGNGGGKYLLVGPGWTGEKPVGIDKVLQSETQFFLAIFRTQLINPADLDNVQKIQAGYKLEPLSSFQGTAAASAAPEIKFVTPLAPAEERTSLDGFNILSFLLQFAPTVPSEVDLRARLGMIGIEPGKPFDAAGLSPELQQALKAGMADGQKEIDAARAAAKSSADMFGTRAFMKNNYVNRAAGAQSGIFGNSVAEAFYGLYEKAGDGAPLNGSNRYQIHYDKGQFPPAKAFWSLTMYDLPQQLLVANPINRYLVNSPMLPNLKLDADGGLTVYVQHDSPGTDKEANWLPAPAGPFMVVTRIYYPERAVLDGSWTQPAMTISPK